MHGEANAIRIQSQGTLAAAYRCPCLNGIQPLKTSPLNRWMETMSKKHFPVQRTVTPNMLLHEIAGAHSLQSISPTDADATKDIHEVAVVSHVHIDGHGLCLGDLLLKGNFGRFSVILSCKHLGRDGVRNKQEPWDKRDPSPG